MEKTIVAYLVAIFITVVFVKTKFADKWIFSKIRIAYWQLALLQIMGYALLFLAVYISYISTGMKGMVYHNTSVLEFVFFTFIVLLLVVGLLKGKKWILFISFLSLCIPFLVLYIPEAEYITFGKFEDDDERRDIPHYNLITMNGHCGISPTHRPSVFKHLAENVEYDIRKILEYHINDTDLPEEKL